MTAPATPSPVQLDYVVAEKDSCHSDPRWTAAVLAGKAAPGTRTPSLPSLPPSAAAHSDTQGTAVTERRCAKQHKGRSRFRFPGVLNKIPLTSFSAINCSCAQHSTSHSRYRFSGGLNTKAPSLPCLPPSATSKPRRLWRRLACVLPEALYASGWMCDMHGKGEGKVQCKGAALCLPPISNTQVKVHVHFLACITKLPTYNPSPCWMAAWACKPWHSPIEAQSLSVIFEKNAFGNRYLCKPCRFSQLYTPNLASVPAESSN
eukprot:1150459-Pelagomonas_calceolata.AAC.3